LLAPGSDRSLVRTNLRLGVFTSKTARRCVAITAHNGYPYTAVGRILIDHGIILKEQMASAQMALPMILGDRVQLQQVIINVVMKWR
jgi:hypothetical protein